MFGCTFVGQEELEDLSLGHSGKKKSIHQKESTPVFMDLKCWRMNADNSTDVKILTPCTHECSRTCAALRRSVASRTSSFEMRSLAPSVM